MPATKVIKTWIVTDNYLLLQNNDPATVVVINKLTPPDNVWEGYTLYVEFDNSNKGGGIFIKNKIGADSVGNLRLNCWGRAANTEWGLLTKFSINSGTSQNKHVISHICDALAAIVAADNTARNNAVTAAVAANTINIAEGLSIVNNGPFAYGAGGADFVLGVAVKDTQGGVDYYDYGIRPPFVKLVWDGAFWKQVGSPGLNAIS